MGDPSRASTLTASCQEEQAEEEEEEDSSDDEEADAEVVSVATEADMAWLDKNVVCWNYGHVKHRSLEATTLQQ